MFKNAQRKSVTMLHRNVFLPLILDLLLVPANLGHRGLPK